MIEKETKDLESMIRHGEEVRDGNFSPDYKDASGTVLREEVDRQNNPKPDPHEE